MQRLIQPIGGQTEQPLPSQQAFGIGGRDEGRNVALILEQGLEPLIVFFVGWRDLAQSAHEATQITDDTETREVTGQNGLTAQRLGAFELPLDSAPGLGRSAGLNLPPGAGLIEACEIAQVAGPKLVLPAPHERVRRLRRAHVGIQTIVVIVVESTRRALQRLFERRQSRDDDLLCHDLVELNPFLRLEGATYIGRSQARQVFQQVLVLRRRLFLQQAGRFLIQRRGVLSVRDCRRDDIGRPHRPAVLFQGRIGRPQSRL